MNLDVSKAFVRPMEDFPFEVEVCVEPQDINGDQVTFDPVQMNGVFSNGRISGHCNAFPRYWARQYPRKAERHICRIRPCRRKAAAALRLLMIIARITVAGAENLLR